MLIATFAYDVPDVWSLLTLIAWNDFHRGFYANAIDYCELVSLINKDFQYERQEIEVLTLRALCYIKFSNYQDAIISLKTCLELAFRINDKKVEL